MIPKSLKTWFVVHFALDIMAGIPLLLFPTAVATFLGLEILQTLPLRLVGAALIGIGSTSLLERNSSIESYKSLLTLKIIWSLAAVIGISLTIFDNAPNNVPTYIWGILSIFVIFNFVWIYYYRKLKNLIFK